MLGGDALRVTESAPFVYSSSVSSALIEAAFYGYLLRRSALDSLLGETFKDSRNPARPASLSLGFLPYLIRQLFGIGYESETFWSSQDASSSLHKLAEVPHMLPNRPVVFHLAIQEKHPQEKYFPGKHIPEKQQAIVFEAMREERVFFRNNIGKLFSLSSKNFATQAMSIFFPT
jgi:hypothetical protein